MADSRIGARNKQDEVREWIVPECKKVINTWIDESMSKADRNQLKGYSRANAGPI